MIPTKLPGYADAMAKSLFGGINPVGIMTIIVAAVIMWKVYQVIRARQSRLKDIPARE